MKKPFLKSSNKCFWIIRRTYYLTFRDIVIETHLKRKSDRKLMTIRARYKTMDDIEIFFVTQPHRALIQLDQPVRFVIAIIIAARHSEKSRF